MASPTAQFIEIWRRLKFSQRAAVIGALVVTLALIGAIVYYGSQPDYGVLFTDLKPADGQQIVEKLKTAQVPYQLSNGGTTISVPTEKVTELRLQMAAAGALSASHVGFDIFDKSSFGATDFTQQVNYQRALEGELARTLEGMKEVDTARVHITRSRESVFTDKAEPAKASVMLKLKSRDLSPERTEAIVSLVASAVEGLEADNVSVMDSDGGLLTGPSGRKGLKGGGGFDSQMEVRRKYESESAEQIVLMLEPVMGAGHVRANVTADIDFNQIEQTEETFDPKTPVVRNQQTAQEFKNSPPSSGGVAGTRANDPTAPATTQTTSAASGNGRTSSNTTYEISKVTRRTIGNGGRVTRMSVSVLVDSNQKAEGADEAETSKRIQELVTAAVGIDATRGDRVAVQMIPFQQQPVVETPHLSWFERNRELVKTAIKYGLLAFVALLLIITVIRPARRALRQASKQDENLMLEAAPEEVYALPPSMLEEHSEPAPRTVAEIQAATAPRTVAQIEAETEKELLNMEVPRPKETAASLRKHRVVEYTREDPEKAAMAIRTWLQQL